MVFKKNEFYLILEENVTYFILMKSLEIKLVILRLSSNYRKSIRNEITISSI